ncbi:MAG: helix-turn-helix domain-containing protein [Clostridia bacterium]
MDEKELKRVIASNLTYYRKRANITQFELAAKLNYSDKSVSKWERGDGLPDFLILTQLAEFYGITVNDFLNPNERKTQPISKKNRFLIPIIASGFVWLVATIIFVMTLLLDPSIRGMWKVFLYAVPVSAIVLIVFSNIFHHKWWTCVFVSVLIWGLCFSLYFSITNELMWLIFLLGGVVQVLTILWFLLKIPDKIKRDFKVNKKK